MSKSTDSSRYCATHQSWGDHHTDRCPETYGKKTPAEHEWDVVQQQRKIITGEDPKPYPGETMPKDTSKFRWFRKRRRA